MAQRPLTSDIFSICFSLLQTSSPGQPLIKAAFPSLNANGHFHLPEGILAHKVGVAFVNALHKHIGVGHAGVREQEELGSCQGLEHGQPEE